MGLIGFSITLVIMVLGAGYYFFGMAPTSLTITNEAPAPITESVTLAEILKDQANDIKNTVEAKAQADKAMLDDPSFGEASVPKNDVSRLSITDRLMKTGFAVSVKKRTIDTLVLHSSYNPYDGDPYSVAALVKIYERYGVSAHYLIDRNGQIYRLVDEKNIAYHAGASQMADGRENVNDLSIGIEMMNKEDTEYTKEQYVSVKSLVEILKKKYAIKYVVGHDDIAPLRKTDPWNFDWQKLRE